MSVQNEKLIEEAAKAIRDVREVVVPRGDGYVSVTDADDATLARAAFAVFEKAHAHECEMCRWENGFGARKPLTHTCEKNLSTDDFPHGYPEMDPTDDERKQEFNEFDETLAALADAGVVGQEGQVER
jgi:hypothetical protein